MAKPQKFEDLGIVVEHFFKMRHEPSLVGRIARIAAAEMIVDAAFGHFGQRQFDEIAVGRVGQPRAGAPEQFENGRIRKFRRPGEAAMDGVDEAGDLRRETSNCARLIPPPPPRRTFGKFVADDVCILRDPRGLRAKGFGNRFQHAHEGRPAIVRDLGKISAAPERFASWRQEHGQGPAAAFAKSVQSRHINMIDIGALLAIDLDVHEKLVHHGRGRFVLKTFMRHHMAPMAGGIADREQNRLIYRLRFRERRRAPHPPMHGILGVLQKIRARGLAKLVWC